jgi:hypothetical protein
MQNLLATDTTKIIEDYNKKYTNIFEKNNFSEFINILEISKSKEIRLNKIICLRVFSDSVFKFNQDNKRIKVIKFNNKIIEGELNFYFIPNIGFLYMKLDKFRSINGYIRKINGVLFYYRDNFYFIGKWPYSRGNYEKYKRVSCLIKFSKSLKFLSLLQFNFIKEINDEFKYQHVLQKSVDTFICKKFKNFEDRKFIFYLNKLNIPFNKHDNEIKEAIISPVSINKILLMSGNVFFVNPASERTLSRE